MNLLKARDVLLALAVFALSLLPFLVNARPLSTQKATGRIQGVVLAPDNAKVAGAKVTLMRDPDQREILADDEGEFDARLPAGVYRLTVGVAGFCKFEKDGLVVRSGATELFSIHLEVRGSGCQCSPR